MKCTSLQPFATIIFTICAANCNPYQKAAQTSDTATINDSMTESTSGETSDSTVTDTDTGMEVKCGNGQIDEGEVCDIADEDNRPCKDDCSALFCGDGIIQEDLGEVCDAGLDSDKCSNDCRPTFCGDGILQSENGEGKKEECDDGGETSICTALCLKTICGDSMVQSPNGHGEMEECDLGAEKNDSSTTCSQSCEFTYCGDDIIQVMNGMGKSEQCDDGMPTETCNEECSPTYCGDGVVQAVNGEGVMEQCDDGNDDDNDGCTEDCTISYVVFVTSETYQGDLAPQINGKTGLELADAHCQELAEKAGLTGKFRAWLSDASMGPANRFENKGTKYPFQLRSGAQLAADWEDLTDGLLKTAIDHDQNNEMVSMKPNEQHVYVWTHTSISGNPLDNSPGHCDSWTLNDNAVGDLGYGDTTDTTWTNSGFLTSCSVAHRLYCFQTSITP